jgi:hypothetical protein
MQVSNMAAFWLARSSHFLSTDRCAPNAELATRFCPRLEANRSDHPNQVLCEATAQMTDPSRWITTPAGR